MLAEKLTLSPNNWLLRVSYRLILSSGRSCTLLFLPLPSGWWASFFLSLLQVALNTSCYANDPRQPRLAWSNCYYSIFRTLRQISRTGGLESLSLELLFLVSCCVGPRNEAIRVPYYQWVLYTVYSPLSVSYIQ